MKISRLRLQNFKRFSDLTIEQIPESSKLVLLIGANGSGKSSIFDAFSCLQNIQKKDVNLISPEFLSYYSKNQKDVFEVEITFSSQEKIVLNDTIVKASENNYDGVVYLVIKGGEELNELRNNPKYQNLFYGRTSFRQIPRLQRTALGQGGQFNFEQDSDRPKFFIDKDSRFENDIEKITEIILKDFFRAKQSNQEITQNYITPINRALENIFGKNEATKLELLEIIPPIEGKIAQINFKKGTSEIHYNYLSAGEKEVFNILINLLSRASLYPNAIYFFDEIDLHLNTTIQFNLLKEITENWLPPQAQLWTASHSLGFIAYARESEWASIIDFDNYDFDQAKTLSPEAKDNPAIYEIAVGKEYLESLFRDKKICFVENQDKTLYSLMGLDNVVFVPEHNRNAVYYKVLNSNFFGLVDRDFLSDEDVSLIRKHCPRLYVLSYYSIENYLYHPDNLADYYHNQQKAFDKVAYINALRATKNTVKDEILLKILSDRESYGYFKEKNLDARFQHLTKRFQKSSENNAQAKLIAGYLKSDDFETFYKVLPMKNYATNLPQRHNIPKSHLAQTSYFRQTFTQLLNQKSE